MKVILLCLKGVCEMFWTYMVKSVLIVMCLLYSVTWFNEASKANTNGGTGRFLVSVVASLLNGGAAILIFTLL